jgi:hypothetical protein
MRGEIETIIEVGAEGGSITLLGIESDEGWRFRRQAHDCSDADDEPTQTESEWVASWTSALRLMDKYPWDLLLPLKVHPDFRTRVWEEVQKRLEKRRLSSEDRQLADPARWEQLCRNGSPSPKQLPFDL